MSTRVVAEREAIVPPDPTLIPIPHNFPVTWLQPEEARLFWMRQQMHFPEPMTPLDEWLLQGEFDGVNRIAKHYCLPFYSGGRRFNTYAYAHLTPLPLSPMDIEAQGRQAQEKLGVAMDGLLATWENEYLPEIQQILNEWNAFDLEAATLPSLITRLEEMKVGRERLWDIHFLVWFPAYTAISLFEELYRDLFHTDKSAGESAGHAFDAYRLLQGFSNKTIETAHALWQLSRQAIALPTVQLVLQTQAGADVLASLSETVEGATFLAELYAYLNEYGQRSDKWVMSVPTWLENPTPVIKNLQDYITQPDRDLQAEMTTLAAERERHLTTMRLQLQDYPQPVIKHFEFLLKAAQEATILTEDHGFWLDFRGWYPLRRLFLEVGRRFAEAKALERAEDIFYLTIDEIPATATALQRVDRRPLVAGRQAEATYFHGIQPPPVLGTMPAGPPADDPVSRTFGKFFGAPPPPSTDPNLLQGHGGAPGIVRGPAKVIRTLAEATKLQLGDVLVAETTAPPWTPLFATAAAVVTDTGGILSHCAVVAREYGIPAVVGVGAATTAITDGQMLEVDGAAGLVRILADV